MQAGGSGVGGCGCCSAVHSDNPGDDARVIVICSSTGASYWQGDRHCFFPKYCCTVVSLPTPPWDGRLFEAWVVVIWGNSWLMLQLWHPMEKLVWTISILSCIKDSSPLRLSGLLGWLFSSMWICCFSVEYHLWKRSRSAFNNAASICNTWQTCKSLWMRFTNGLASLT